MQEALPCQLLHRCLARAANPGQHGLHLAAQPLVRLSYARPLETLEVNVVGTANVLEALRRLEASGPLPMRDLPDTCAVPWRSSG